MKLCRVCSEEKQIEEFNRDRGNKDGHASICKSCSRASDIRRYSARREKQIAYLREYYKNNKDKLRAAARRWYLMNQDRTKATRAAWLARNPEKRREIRQKWDRINQAQRNENTVRRRRLQLEAVPLWANKGVMRAIYAEAKRLSVETGIIHHVDHIVPISSPLVCGLHVENNLRAVPWRENVLKHNRYWPDMPGGSPCLL
jgi:superfamily II helicase